MIITIAGIKRSGSTAQYNIVRLACEYAGYTVNPKDGTTYEIRKVPERQVDIVKLHPFRPKLALASDHIFLTYRKPKEILESLERFNGKEQSVQRFYEFFQYYFQWCLETDRDHFMLYKTLTHEPQIFVQNVINVLGFKIHAKPVLDDFKKIEPPEDEYDPVTMMFPNHRTST